MRKSENYVGAAIVITALITAVTALSAADTRNAASPASKPSPNITMTVYNVSGRPLTDTFIAYAQPFDRADMPSGYHPVVHQDETPLTTQIDGCSKWLPDGSC